MTKERGIDGIWGTLVTELISLCLDYEERESEFFDFQRRNRKNRKPGFTEKVKLMLTEDTICPFTHLIYCFEPFLQWRKQSAKTWTQSPPKLLLMSKQPISDEIDKNDPSLAKEIQHLVREERELKMVHNDKTERLSGCFKVHMKDFLTEFNCYELFYIIWIPV